jgi:hypothetical protein
MSSATASLPASLARDRSPPKFAERPSSGPGCGELPPALRSQHPTPDGARGCAAATAEDFYVDAYTERDVATIRANESTASPPCIDEALGFEARNGFADSSPPAASPSPACPTAATSPTSGPPPSASTASRPASTPPTFAPTSPRRHYAPLH